MTTLRHVRNDEASAVERDGLTIREFPGSEPMTSVVEVDVASGVVHPSTRSSSCGSVYYCISGQLEFEVQGERFRVHSGDVVHVLPQEWFAYRNSSGERARLLSVNVPAFDAETFERKGSDNASTLIHHGQGHHQ